MLKRSVFLFIVAGLLCPGAAVGSITVAHSGSTTTIVGDADNDDVTVEFTYIPTPAISGNGFRVTNPQGVTPGPGCVPESTTAVVCPYGDGTVTRSSARAATSSGSPTRTTTTRTSSPPSPGRAATTRSAAGTAASWTAEPATTRCARSASPPSRP